MKPWHIIGWIIAVPLMLATVAIVGGIGGLATHSALPGLLTIAALVWLVLKARD